MEIQQYKLAETHFSQAIDQDASLAVAHAGMGAAMSHSGQSGAAFRCFARAVGLDPHSAIAHCGLGKVLAELGDFEQSQAELLKAISLDSTHAVAWALLAEQRRGEMRRHHITEIQYLLTQDLPAPKRASLHFALGHVFDTHPALLSGVAANHWELANTLRKRQREAAGLIYDRDGFEQFVVELSYAFTPEFFQKVKGWGNPCMQPVFIVGMPRSGTSLIEQILASHSDVHGGGELNVMAETFNKFVASIGNQINAVTDWSIQSAAMNYLNALPRDKGRHVDKMPDNYLYLGLIAAALPGAKIIHCSRDPRDTAVSCWSTDFGQIRWASDQKHLAHRFQQYARVMAHWRKVLPIQIHECVYEKTVQDVEKTARDLIEFVGLPWQDACLNFHATQRSVHTASTSQVRKPIYRSSVGRWKRYEPFLGDLFAQLPI